MATPTSTSTSTQRPTLLRPGFFSRAGKMVGDMLGLNTPRMSQVAANRPDNFQSRAGYSVQVQRTSQRTIDGRSHALAPKTLPPDGQLVAFLNHISEKGV